MIDGGKKIGLPAEMSQSHASSIAAIRRYHSLDCSNFIAGGPASQKMGAVGTRNPEWTLFVQLTLVFGLDATRRFLMLRTQLEASCATRAPKAMISHGGEYAEFGSFQ